MCDDRLIAGNGRRQTACCERDESRHDHKHAQYSQDSFGNDVFGSGTGCYRVAELLEGCDWQDKVRSKTRSSKRKIPQINGMLSWLNDLALAGLADDRCDQTKSPKEHNPNFVLTIEKVVKTSSSTVGTKILKTSS